MRRLTLLAPFVVLAVASPAFASYSGSGTATAAFTAATLAAPTNLVATGGCAGTAAPKVTLTWTASTSAYATGYDVYRQVGIGSSTYLTTVSGGATVTYTDTSVLILTSYTYTLKTRYQNWIKASSNASATTPAVCL